jgi:hypothetical protein
MPPSAQPDPLGPTGRKSLAHLSPRAPPQRGAVFALSRTLRYPLLFCGGIIATGFALKMVGMNLIVDFIAARLSRQGERDRAAVTLAAAKWQRALAEDEAAGRGGGAAPGLQ